MRSYYPRRNFQQQQQQQQQQPQLEQSDTLKERSQRDLLDHLRNCIEKNYLLIIAVTSYTQGKLKSDNLPFGVGKTTCGMDFNAWMNCKGWRYGEHWYDNIDWELTKHSMYYSYEKLMRRLKRFDGVRVNNGLYDDVQMTAPATKNVDRKIYDVVFYISTARPEMASLTLTCPNLLMIAAPFRNIVNVEIIVPERGVFEVQRIMNYKNFKKPREDLSKLRYLEEGGFRELPKEIQNWYDQWREDEKRDWHKKHPDASGGDEEDEVAALNLTPQQIELLTVFVRKGSRKKTEVVEDGSQDMVEDLVSKGLLRYTNAGYLVAPTKKGNGIVIGR